MNSNINNCTFSNNFGRFCPLLSVIGDRPVLPIRCFMPNNLDQIDGKILCDSFSRLVNNSGPLNRDDDRV